MPRAAGVGRTSPEPGAASEAFRWELVRPQGEIAFREAGRARDVVLLHGLGMSSAYFARLAKALHTGGCSPIAPDVPGLSRGSSSASWRQHFDLVTRWADSVGISSAAWVGHSLGCNLVARIANQRPDLVRCAALIAPLTPGRHFLRLRSFALLMHDALRETRESFGFAVLGALDTGLIRCWRTFREYQPTLGDPAEIAPGALIIAGANDPFRDPNWPAVQVPGAHGCHITHPSETASALLPWLTRDHHSPVSS
ncbi:MAG: alpha/beta fold hydrolase [Thermoanaerobaculia bacterium]